MDTTLYDGADEFDRFFRYYYARKVLDSNEKRMKLFIASIKKFYRFLFEAGYINQQQHDEAMDCIASSKDSWFEEMHRYDLGLPLGGPLTPYDF